MKALLLLPILLLLGGSLVSAQTTPALSTNWTTVQRCITAPSQPPQGWTYNGVIFTFKQGDGIHARRADVATPYYVAYDSDSEYGVAGRFSPDGQWFAVPEGHKEYADDAGPDYYFHINEVRVYSTKPSRQTYDVPITRTYLGMSPHSTIPPILWLSNQQFVTQGVPDLYAEHERQLVNPFNGTTESYEYPIPNAYYVSVSPDGSRFVYLNNEQTGNYVMTSEGVLRSHTLDFTTDLFAPMPLDEQWTDDSSRFAALMSGLHEIGIYDRDGHLLDGFEVSNFISHFSFASDGAELAYVESKGYVTVPDIAGGFDDALDAGTIHIVDFATRTITDTCIETPYAISFSPDGRQLAFGLEDAGFIYILDLQAWQTYRIDLAAADVVGWYPIT